MSLITVDVGDFVAVSVQVSPLAIPYELFGLPVVIGDTPVIDVNQRIREYSTINQVAADFGTTSPEYLACAVFLEQQPQPSSIMVGRWASTATAGLLHAATLTPTEQLLSNFTVITAGSFWIAIDGVRHAITGISLASALNLNGVAALIQAQLPAGVTCVWNASFSRFDITSSTTGPASSVSFGAPPTAIGSIAFSNVPANLDTVTIAGTVVTFVSGPPTGNQVQIGSEAATVASLLNFLNNSSDVNLSTCTYNAVGTVIYVVAKASGAGGDSITLAKSSTAITLSGATLAGATGTDISTLLGLTNASGASPLVPGLAARKRAQRRAGRGERLDAMVRGFIREHCGAGDERL